jgi:hypothetical protein
MMPTLDSIILGTKHVSRIASRVAHVADHKMSGLRPYGGCDSCPCNVRIGSIDLKDKDHSNNANDEDAVCSISVLASAFGRWGGTLQYAHHQHGCYAHFLS